MLADKFKPWEREADIKSHLPYKLSFSISPNLSENYQSYNLGVGAETTQHKPWHTSLK